MTPEPRKKAVALHYDADADHAPRITATGTGSVAERILEAALENGIPIREDPDLAGALAGLDLWQTVPPELYAIIAEVFAWAYRAEINYRDRV